MGKPTTRGDRAPDRQGPAPRHLDVLPSALLGALLLGVLGFAGGFFGPLILTPNANQGPLLGIFITGPLGVVLGAVGGGILSLVTRPRR